MNAFNTRSETQKIKMLAGLDNYNGNRQEFVSQLNIDKRIDPCAVPNKKIISY